MTTELLKNSSPRLPAPDRYAAHVECVLNGAPGETTRWNIALVVAVYVFLLLFGFCLPT